MSREVKTGQKAKVYSLHGNAASFGEIVGSEKGKILLVRKNEFATLPLSQIDHYVGCNEVRFV